MKPSLLSLMLLCGLALAAANANQITSVASGAVVTDVEANVNRAINDPDDLQDLVDTAWGEGWLGLHRGHRPIMDVLKAFLGISHDEMHVFMEDMNLNLAGTCEQLGFDPEKLVESLTASFQPFVDEALTKGIIDSSEASIWLERYRETFSRPSKLDG